MFKISGSNVYFNDEVLPINSANFTRISDHVGKDKKKVYWGKTVIKGADAKTFEFLAPDNFYRDRKRVYYLGQEIEHADPNTFTIFHCTRGMTQFGYYAKDDSHAFYIHTFRFIRVKKINSSSLKSFYGVDDLYALDDEYVYGRGVKRKNSDPGSLTDLGHGYWQDKNNVYYDGKVLESADAKSFMVIGGNMYATDRFNLFWNGQLWNDFKENNATKEVKAFIRENKRLKEYWWNQPDLGRSREYGVSFDGEEGYFIQANQVFWEGILLKHADYKTFSMLNQYYAKDKNYAYYTDRKLIRSDVKTFSLIDDQLDSEDYHHGLYARDKTSFYYKGVIDKRIDIRSYKILNSCYAKDKKSVYYKLTHTVRAASPKTFTVIADEYGLDGEKTFKHGVRVLEE